MIPVYIVMILSLATLCFQSGLKDSPRGFCVGALIVCSIFMFTTVQHNLLVQAVQAVSK